MDFQQQLVPATFIRREKRFFIHARLDDGRQVVAHTNNTGRMTGCLAPGARVWLSPADNPKRQLKWTLEISETVADPRGNHPGGVMVGVNTIMANRLIREALEAGMLPHLAGYSRIRAEVPFGKRGSRADFLLSDDPQRPACWVEVKNVTLVQDGIARFPDAPSQRGVKHLLELEEMMARGDCAALVFCIQRADASSFTPAQDVDPIYARQLGLASAKGLQVFALQHLVSEKSISAMDLIPCPMVY